ncbi:CgeB family protein [Carboxydothermus pertinax]|uniref:Spore protein YkvP/CgeB glycosyl transferase-like domain-containing protein n=1 Tax=Carboxydothermus pertinax TaxID=870242 RepID=A0A1L8CYH2_9THEO|nr:glycosyltransferase [Carboxydothermus pertinax]GAV23965.1 hypothetical protein cpu_24750 [Carboxydothermus pertinax]
MKKYLDKIRVKLENVTKSTIGTIKYKKINSEVLIENLVDVYNLNSNKPRILYVAMKWDYGDRNRGLSFEELNFFYSLLFSGYPIIKFNFDRIIQEIGVEKTQELLFETAFLFSPDIVFHFIFKDEIQPETLQKISKKLNITTIVWFADDHWRLNSFSLQKARYYDWVCTTFDAAVPIYKENGIKNVILTQWAANQYIYRYLKLPYKYDVSFVGQPHGNRRQIVNELRVRGINVATWGYGWENGRVSVSEMILIFNQSKINLNLSNASKNININQIKGRDFEVPSCGGFLLTQHNDKLQDYFKINEEIVTYYDIDDLVYKIKYYLEHDEEREKIKISGWQRVLRDHTYEKRFSDILKIIKGNVND